MMGASRYITDAKGLHCGLLIDFEIIREMIKKRKNLIVLMEDIEDILAVELSKNKKTFTYREVRKKILNNSQ